VEVVTEWVMHELLKIHGMHILQKINMFVVLARSQNNKHRKNWNRLKIPSVEQKAIML